MTAASTLYPRIDAVAAQLARGATSAVQLVEAALERAAAGEGPQVFTRLHTETALAEARASDVLRAAGLARSPIEGVPISIKDSFDVAGQVTTAGSRLLQAASPAARSATVVQRLRKAGAVVVGSTNMTEFAYSGLGLNPHYGTPQNPWERGVEGGRIPGGSSSGAAVSVTDAMAVAAIGTDTGGSVRIPSALCGLTGWKPTARRIPQDGVLPLSMQLDSVGPLAASVQCCATLDALLSGHDEVPVLSAAALQGLRLLAPTNVVLDGMDAVVAARYERALQRLSAAGVRIVEAAVPAFDALAGINAKGGLTAAEAWAWHQHHLARHADAYDPRVGQRIVRGKDITAADFLELLQRRTQWIAQVQAQMADVDAMLMPTVPVVAPRMAALQRSDDAYFATNGLLLRNPTFINFLDGCAISLPCHLVGEAPVGLSLAGLAGQDARLLGVALAVQDCLARA